MKAEPFASLGGGGDRQRAVGLTLRASFWCSSQERGIGLAPLSCDGLSLQPQALVFSEWSSGLSVLLNLKGLPRPHGARRLKIDPPDLVDLT